MDNSEEPTMFPCKRCGHDFNERWKLVKHLKTQRICRPRVADIPKATLLDELEQEHNRNCVLFCRHCGHGFNSRSGLFYHEKGCRANQPEQPVEVEEEEATNITISRQEMEDLLEFVRIVKAKEVGSIANTTNTNIENQTVNQINQNINQNIDQSTTTNNFFILPFGQENTDFIQQQTGFLNSCCDRPEAGVIKVIRTTYFHPARSENYNITHVDDKIYTYDGEKWIVAPSKNKVLDETIGKAKDIMDNHYVNVLKKDPLKFMLTISSMIAFGRRMQRGDIEVVRNLRKNTENMIKEESEKIHSKMPNMPSTC